MSKRPDAIGFFWEDLAAVKPPKKEKPKRTPPERTWEHPDYLPGLYEALAFRVDLLTDADLFRLQGQRMLFDIEVYRNYFLAAFRCPTTNKVAYFEMGMGIHLNIHKLLWMLQNFCIVGFNSRNYDIPITTLAASGCQCDILKWASDEIIVNGTRPQDVLKGMHAAKLDLDHIDLIEVAPLTGSLKKYAARLHIPRMQDLPFPPETILSHEQAQIVKWYCVNSDLPATKTLHEALLDQLTLRESMSYQYKTDLRSKSDAQVAEAVIGAEMKRITGKRPTVPEIAPGTVYRYKVPAFMRFQSPLMNWALEKIATTDYIVSETGGVYLPESISGLSLRIASADYRIGNGGLHSSESKVTHIADGSFRILDRDVESFYPRIILNQRLFPKHLGATFLQVYQEIVDRRVHAKRMQKQCKEAGDKQGEAKWKVEQESLKITINGSFGKLGSMFSILYAPDLMIQVTLTGQLSLLMLIERMELACIPVISANTDGIVMRVPTHMQAVYEAVVKQWELDTDYITEETEYAALLSRDVNNYIAIKKKDGDTKNKGAFANPWNIPNNIWRLHKNPVNMICTEAIEQHITKRVPIAKTIRECTDITKFVTVRDAKGGGVKLDGEGKTQEYMGKMLRWYYAKEEPGEIVYAKSGNKVARSEGAKPLMDLPASFPADVDHEWYIKEAEDMLVAVGYT